MKNIYDYSLEQLTEYFASIKQKPFRAKQVFSWLYQKDARSFDDMSDLSKDLRNQMCIRDRANKATVICGRVKPQGNQ